MGSGYSSTLVNESKNETNELIRDFIAKHCTIQDELFTVENQLFRSMRTYITKHSKMHLVHREFMTMQVAREMVSKSTNGQVSFMDGTAIGIRLNTWPG